MTIIKSVCAYAPASMGNVSVGYDLLGAALAPLDGEPLGDRVWAELAPAMSLECHGPYADRLPPGEDENIVWQCARRFLDAIGRPELNVALKLEKNLPIGSGLGSSASSVVAALVAMNQLFDQPLDKGALLELMGELEGKISGSVHYDNVAPSYLGGLQLMVPGGAQALPAFEHWRWVVAYPGITLSTAKMRALLPKSWSTEILIQYGRGLAAFVDACHRGDEASALALLKDVVAEPYRAPHVPGYLAAREHLLADGCEVVGISGSGPTLFALCRDDETANRAATHLQQHYLLNERGLVRICTLAREGSQAWEQEA